MSFKAALAALGGRRDDPALLADLAELALSQGEEEAALAIIEPAARAGREARLWQWTALLHRSIDQHERALDAFSRASDLAPGDASIAHGHARVALEAGIPSVALFDKALRLGPSGDVILGRAAARFAEGAGAAAADELAAVLAANPLWYQGHVQWAQLASMIGRAAEATITVDRAIERHRADAAPWQALIHILNGAQRYDEAWRSADQAIEATGNSALFSLPRAAALSDAGELAGAAAAFDDLGQPAAVDHAVHLARHGIRSGDWRLLAALADRWMTGDTAHFFWPYASIAWRQAKDDRWHWLEGDERLVQLFDIKSQIPSLEALAERLRRLHAGSGRFLDQSVRGGTQTDGPLFSRIDPEIRALRTAISDAVETYRAQLPPPDETHPMLRRLRTGRPRYAGSWSVRLSGAGYHSAHVHPQGWISSAFYVAVPEPREEQGWLVLGEPHPDLSSGLPPVRKLAPKAGQLVLFPSMMWHGTLPFDEGERMTVAFDVAPPTHR